MNTFLSGGVVGDIALDRALSLPESRAAIEAETGKLPETPSQARKAARDWAAERKQEAQAKPGLVRDGYSAHLDAQAADRLDRIAKRAGVSIAFSDRLGDAVGEYRDGQITLRTGTENPEMRVLVHELTHHLETSGDYQALSDSIVKFVETEKGVPFAELIRQQQDEYAGFGDTLTEDGARRELIANFAQDYLFTDERSIRRLARENRSLVQKIRDWLHDFAVRLRGSAEESSCWTRKSAISARWKAPRDGRRAKHSTALKHCQTGRSLSGRIGRLFMARIPNSGSSRQNNLSILKSVAAKISQYSALMVTRCKLQSVPLIS